MATNSATCSVPIATSRSLSVRTSRFTKSASHPASPIRPSAQPNPFLNYEFYCVRSILNKDEKNLYRTSLGAWIVGAR